MPHIDDLSEDEFRDTLSEIQESARYDYWEELAFQKDGDEIHELHSLFHDLLVDAAINDWSHAHDSALWDLLVYLDEISEDDIDRYSED